MSNSKLSKEYISESDSSEDELEFTPPRHFHELKLSKNSKFQPSKNKEIWLFKLPTSLDLKDLSSLPISLEDANISGSIFTHNKVTYRITQETFLQDLTTNKYSIITPSKNKNFKIDKESKIKRIFTIAETVKIPEIDLSRVKIARTDVPKEENLRMRHFPTGYGAKDFKELQLLVVQSPVKKRKLEETEAKEEDSEKKSKKDKKEKKEKKDKKDKKKDKKKKD